MNYDILFSNASKSTRNIISKLICQAIRNVGWPIKAKKQSTTKSDSENFMRWKDKTISKSFTDFIKLIKLHFLPLTLTVNINSQIYAYVEYLDFTATFCFCKYKRKYC